MKEYNEHDTLLLEEIYLKLRPYMKTHPNYGTYNDKGIMCPRCGSKHLQSRGFAVTTTRKYRRLHCQSCGSWSRETRSEPINIKPLTNI